MSYTSTRPFPGDHKNVLLKKLLQAWGGTVPNGPSTDTEILRLIVRQVTAGTAHIPPDMTEIEALQTLLRFFGGGTGCANLAGAGSPNGSIPNSFQGQYYDDTAAGDIYVNNSAPGDSSAWTLFATYTP